MPPREASNVFPDKYLAIDYDVVQGMMALPHDIGATNPDAANFNDMDIDPPAPQPQPDPTDHPLATNTAEEVSHSDVDNDAQNVPVTAQEISHAIPSTGGAQQPHENLSQALSGADISQHYFQGVHHPQIPRIARRNTNRNPLARVVSNGDRIISINGEEVDPLSVDLTDPEDQEASGMNSMILDAAMAGASDLDGVVVVNRRRSYQSAASSSSPIGHNAPRSGRIRAFSDDPRRRSVVTPTGEDSSRLRAFGQVVPNASFRPFAMSDASIASVLDQDPSQDSCSDDEADDMPDLDTTQDDSITSPPFTPPHSNALRNSSSVDPSAGEISFSPVRRLLSAGTNVFGSSRNVQNANMLGDEDQSSSASFHLGNTTGAIASSPPTSLNSVPAYSPNPSVSMSSNRSGSSSSNSFSSGPSVHWNGAFDSSSYYESSASEPPSPRYTRAMSENLTNAPSETHRRHINLSFSPTTTLSDLKYFAEQGCIAPVLAALNTPNLKTLGARMLADYAKMPHRRIAVASNKRILEFCCETMLQPCSSKDTGVDWPAREYAVETIRSLTATEDSDTFLMGCKGLLRALAMVARGGPFANVQTAEKYGCQLTVTLGLVSGKARLHACIAIMNLSCGKVNKTEIASIPEVLTAMRDVMVSLPVHFAPATSAPLGSGSSNNTTPGSVSEEARLKATTCIKNLSNADANDAVLLNSKGLVEALAYVAGSTCKSARGATNCTTNACLGLMNLSIAKGNKHKVFKTKGVMDALITVITNTCPTMDGANKEARIKACSALSNLAIGYENKVPMFNYPGFVQAILQVIETDSGEARTKACSILWSFAAEMKNQVPVVKRGDIVPTLVRVAEEDDSTEARFKCVAALTLLAESLENAMPLLESGALHPLMDILHDAGTDPTQWKGQTASWCVGFLMNMAQSDDAAPYLREAGVVELLAPLLTIDHYQSLKAAMAITFVCRYDEDDETYDLLRKTENVIPKIINLLHNTIAGRGGNGYKYGVFTLRSSVGCIASLASGPEFMKERIASEPVFSNLLQVVSDFCVNGGTDGEIVGGGRDDALSATLAIRAIQGLTEYLIPIPGSSSTPFGSAMDQKLLVALESFVDSAHPDVKDSTRQLAQDAYNRIQRSLDLGSDNESESGSESCSLPRPSHMSFDNSFVASLVQGCCIGPTFHQNENGFFPSMVRQSPSALHHYTQKIDQHMACGSDDVTSQSSADSDSIRTFLLTDNVTGRRFVVPTDPSGGRSFNDFRLWCYRRGRYCKEGEVPDPNYQWNDELQRLYMNALEEQRKMSSTSL
jgi:hypothetical protein